MVVCVWYPPKTSPWQLWFKLNCFYNVAEFWLNVDWWRVVGGWAGMSSPLFVCYKETLYLIWKSFVVVFIVVTKDVQKTHPKQEVQQRRRRQRKQNLNEITIRRKCQTLNEFFSFYFHVVLCSFDFFFFCLWLGVFAVRIVQSVGSVYPTQTHTQSIHVFASLLSVSISISPMTIWCLKDSFTYDLSVTHVARSPGEFCI